jgi:hypothetical protein
LRDLCQTIFNFEQMKDFSLMSIEIDKMSIKISDLLKDGNIPDEGKGIFRNSLEVFKKLATGAKSSLLKDSLRIGALSTDEEQILLKNYELILLEIQLMEKEISRKFEEHENKVETLVHKMEIIKSVVSEKK